MSLQRGGEDDLAEQPIFLCAVQKNVLGLVHTTISTSRVIHLESQFLFLLSLNSKGIPLHPWQGALLASAPQKKSEKQARLPGEEEHASLRLHCSLPKNHSKEPLSISPSNRFSCWRSQRIPSAGGSRYCIAELGGSTPGVAGELHLIGDLCFVVISLACASGRCQCRQP